MTEWSGVLKRCRDRSTQGCDAISAEEQLVTTRWLAMVNKVDYVVCMIRSEI